MRAVNLLPAERPQREKWLRSKLPVFLLVGAVAVVGGVLATGYIHFSGNVSSKQESLRAAEKELAALPVPAATASPVAAEEVARRATALSIALSHRMAWDRVLNDLSRVLPDDVWLNGLQGESPNPLGAAAAEASSTAAATAPSVPQEATGLRLDGFTYSQEGVARALSRLAVLPWLQNVQLKTSALVRVGRQKVVQFSVLADIVDKGAAS